MKTYLLQINNKGLLYGKMKYSPYIFLKRKGEEFSHCRFAVFWSDKNWRIHRNWYFIKTKPKAHLKYFYFRTKQINSRYEDFCRIDFRKKYPFI